MLVLQLCRNRKGPLLFLMKGETKSESAGFGRNQAKILPYCIKIYLSRAAEGTGPVMPGNLGKAKEPSGLADQKVPIPAVYTER